MVKYPFKKIKVKSYKIYKQRHTSVYIILKTTSHTKAKNKIITPEDDDQKVLKINYLRAVLNKNRATLFFIVAH